MTAGTETTETTDPAKVAVAAELTAGLRALAAMVEANPELAESMRYNLDRILIPVSRAEQPRERIRAFIRAGKAHGAVIEKENNDSWGAANLIWGPVSLHVYANRDQVCERVVVGTETIVEEVPDPVALAAVPKVKQEREVEKVEWRCHPLMDDATDSAAAQDVA